MHTDEWQHRFDDALYLADQMLERAGESALSRQLARLVLWMNEHYGDTDAEADVEANNVTGDADAAPMQHTPTPRNAEGA